MNKVIMMGRMVADAELKTTPSGVTACNFRIAVDRNYQKKGEDKKSDFFNCVAWRGTAEFISKWFPKGRLILVEGEMQTRQYTDKNGNPATWYEIQVDNAHFTGDKGNGSNPGFSGYDAPPLGEPPAGYGGYSAPAQNAPAAAPEASAPAPKADFSSADTDDYPF